MNGDRAFGTEHGSFGFSLLEMLVALGIFLVVAAAALGFVNRAEASLQVQPEVVDMHQRVRASVDALAGDLRMAGAGMSFGANAGPLIDFFAPVVPRRLGATGEDDPVVARPDAITVLYVPGVEGQTTTGEIFASGSDVTMGGGANCGVGSVLCGLQAGMAIGIFDRSAHAEVFTVASVEGALVWVQPHARMITYVYPSGAAVTEIESRTYYFDSANHQLRMSDGWQSDVPVVDHVVALVFEYFGDPQPPTRPRPPLGTENCLYDVSGNYKSPGPSFGQAGSSMALPLSMFSDGPWCGTGAMQFDVDLLRVRAVRVTIRVEATVDAVRGRGSLFSRPGTSASSLKSAPDFMATFRVWPRNLNP